MSRLNEKSYLTNSSGIPERKQPIRLSPSVSDYQAIMSLRILMSKMSKVQNNVLKLSLRTTKPSWLNLDKVLMAN